MPFNRVQFVSPTVEFTLQYFISLLLLCTIFFFNHFPLHEFYFLESPQPPSPPPNTHLITFLNGTFLKNRESRDSTSGRDSFIWKQGFPCSLQKMSAWKQFPCIPFSHSIKQGLVQSFARTLWNVLPKFGPEELISLANTADLMDKAIEYFSQF